MLSTPNDATPEWSTEATPKPADGSSASPQVVWIDSNAVIHLLVLSIAIVVAAVTGRWLLALAIPRR